MMNIRKLTLPILFSLTLAGSPLVLASDKGHDMMDDHHSSQKDPDKGHSSNEALHEMAEIMLRLNHYPSDSEKEKLKMIRNNESTSEQVRALAHAMINIEHKAYDADKPSLKAIMDDSSAPQSVRDMAGIIYNLNHKPSAADKEKLRSMK